MSDREGVVLPSGTPADAVTKRLAEIRAVYSDPMRHISDRDPRADLLFLLSVLDEARETNARLNRRCQSAEAGLAAKLTSGPAFGRALANAAATMYRAQREEADAEIRRLRAEVTRLMIEREALRRVVEAAAQCRGSATFDGGWRMPHDTFMSLCQALDALASEPSSSTATPEGR